MSSAAFDPVCRRCARLEAFQERLGFDAQAFGVRQFLGDSGGPIVETFQEHRVDLRRVEDGEEQDEPIKDEEFRVGEKRIAAAMTAGFGGCVRAGLDRRDKGCVDHAALPASLA